VGILSWQGRCRACVPGYGHFIFAWSDTSAEGVSFSHNAQCHKQIDRQTCQQPTNHSRGIYACSRNRKRLLDTKLSLSSCVHTKAHEVITVQFTKRFRKCLTFRLQFEVKSAVKAVRKCLCRGLNIAQKSATTATRVDQRSFLHSSSIFMFLASHAAVPSDGCAMLQAAAEAGLSGCQGSSIGISRQRLGAECWQRLQRRLLLLRACARLNDNKRFI